MTAVPAAGPGTFANLQFSVDPAAVDAVIAALDGASVQSWRSLCAQGGNPAKIAPSPHAGSPQLTLDGREGSK